MGDDAIARAITARTATPFLNSEQTAYYLGISARQLEIMRGRGEGPQFRRHARFVRYHVDDVIAWSEGTRAVVAGV